MKRAQHPIDSASTRSKLMALLFDSNWRQPGLRDALIGCIDKSYHCYGPFTKKISNSDLKGRRSRLLLPKQFVREFIGLLVNTKKVPREGIPVQTFSTDGEAYSMRLKNWSSGRASSNKKHVLTSNWNRFIRENQSDFQSHFKIWVFCSTKTEEGLCFLISGSL